MLGRKQSLRGDTILADYGPDESYNESAEIEWINKVFINTEYKNKKCRTDFSGFYCLSD